MTHSFKFFLKVVSISFILFIAFVFAANAQTQCKGIKKNKQQCKITAVNAAGYCRFHDPKANYCTFIKKDGQRCHMIVKEGVAYCRFHAKG